MTQPIDLANRYTNLQQRLSMHLPNACANVSVMLPPSFDGELAFYRLVNWAYVLVNEAAKTSLSFLISLPPLRADNGLKKEVSFLRTYVAHNLDLSSKHDKKTLTFVYGWFKEACGVGSPRDIAHFEACCHKLAERLLSTLNGAVDACDLLDDPTDGKRLVDDLKSRIDLVWDAHVFDPIVEACAASIGNPGLDLLAIRAQYLAEWRKVVSTADEKHRHEAIRLKIEETLLTIIGNTLPISAKDASQQLALTGFDATVAALILLRNAREYGSLRVPELIEKVCKVAIESDVCPEAKD